MKKWVLLLLCSLLLFNTPIYASTTELSVKKPTVVKHVFGVHGLSCPFCVVGVKKTLKKVNGVKSVEVSLKHSTVTVFTDKGICFSEEELKKLFSKTGFSYHGTISKPKGCKKSA